MIAPGQIFRTLGLLPEIQAMATDAAAFYAKHRSTLDALAEIYGGTMHGPLPREERAVAEVVRAHMPAQDMAAIRRMVDERGGD